MDTVCKDIYGRSKYERGGEFSSRGRTRDSFFVLERCN